ncbi:MAG: protease inhibitor I42 family protein [Xanthobacteraceae bacterium]
MKAKFFRAKFAASVFCGLLALARLTPPGAQTQPQTNQTVSLSPGASTTIVLRENPSTGFKWRLDTALSTNLAIIRLIDRGYQAAQSGLIGAPGSHRWEIKARAPGTASVVFAYARPWEHGPPAETHVIQVNVARGP